MLLDVSDLHAGYGRAEVLTGLSFGVAEGQVGSIIGPNGAGKSTTLNALMGVLPARGRIVFDGQDLAAATLEERVMLGLAVTGAASMPNDVRHVAATIGVSHIMHKDLVPTSLQVWMPLRRVVQIIVSQGVEVITVLPQAC